LFASGAEVVCAGGEGREAEGEGEGCIRDPGRAGCEGEGREEEEGGGGEELGGEDSEEGVPDAPGEGHGAWAGACALRG